MQAHRSPQNRVMAGVCGGLAAHLGWSPFRLRVVWVLATIFTAFAGGLAYLALWYLMPPEPAAFTPAPLQPWRRSS